MNRLLGRRGYRMNCVWGIVGICALSACSLIKDFDIRSSGIGGPCASDNDCHASTCQQGVCSVNCSSDIDCPEPSRCRKNSCQIPLNAHGIWVGTVASGEGWSLTHQQGIESAMTQLPYLTFSRVEGTVGPAVETSVDTAVKAGSSVIIANSFSHQTQIAKKADEYPNVKFLIATGYPNQKNLGAFFAHLEQAWFVAGKLAAQKSQTKRLGFIGSFVTGEVVRHLNAFTLGARAVDPNIVVEVRWLGFWYDDHTSETFGYKPAFAGPGASEEMMTGEGYLTAKLIDGGADIIAHQLDNQRPGRFVESYTKAGKLLDKDGKPRTVLVIGNDNRYAWKDQSGTPLSTSMGAVYWDWTTLYVRLLDQMHKGMWKPSFVNEQMSEIPENRVVSFEPNEAVVDGMAVKELLAQTAKQGWSKVFEGPYETTGQRAAMPANTSVDEEEWRKMCWLVKGVVEKSNPNQVDSPDQPAKVPDDQYKPANPADIAPTQAPEILLPGFGSTSGQRGIGWNCKENS